MSEAMPFREMCAEIVKADFLRKKDGTAPTAEEIFGYSPRGELSMVFEWYEKAKIINEARVKMTQLCAMYGVPPEMFLP